MLTITTYDWVPEFPRGFVRDIRARWACEEAGLPYRIDTVPLKTKTDAHLARQPFHQLPMLKDGGTDIFESGAIVLHLAGKSDALMSEGTRPEVTQWVLAALNSVEPAIMRWMLAKVFDKDEAAAAKAEPMMRQRLGQLAAVLDGKDWLLGGRFTAADIIMTEVLRQIDDLGALDDHPPLKDYVARAIARPAFRKAHQDQLDHFNNARPPGKDTA